MALELKDLQAEYRVSGSGDSWGQCMAWLFAIADEIHFNRDNLEVPEPWGFRPSPMGQCKDDDGLVELLADADEGALITFANQLWRLRGILKAAGRDY